MIRVQMAALFSTSGKTSWEEFSQTITWKFIQANISQETKMQYEHIWKRVESEIRVRKK